MAMVGNPGSAEHANLREPDEAGVRADGSERSANMARHLYIVHSVDVPACSTRDQSQSVVRPRPVPATPYSKANGMLDRGLQGQIGRMLRDVFADVAHEPVPERFVKLLEALGAKEKQS
jgi:Anti-sigma factor NepR